MIKYEEFELTIIFDKIKKYLQVNNITDNAYHNNEHILNVFNHCMFLFDIYKNQYNLTIYDKLVLGVAALFHDFGHSGGKLSDDRNIEISLIELKKYLKNINKLYLYKDVEKIIVATEYPHKEIKLNMLQKIIMDADIIGSILPGWEKVVTNLAKEYNKTIKEFIDIEISFLNNLVFNLEFCNNLLAENRGDIIKKVQKI